jgi:hypothetical protein
MTRAGRFASAAAVAAVALAPAHTGAQQSQPPQQQTPPVPIPKPFPGATPPPAAPPSRTTDPGASRPATPPPPVTSTPIAAPAPQTPTARQTPDETLLTVKVPPTAEFLESFDAGKGQRYYIFGTNDAFADVVQYFKTALRSGGRELFRTPATQQFDLGSFRDQTMAFPPSVVVKDYTWGSLEGYLFVDGTTSKRFRTIIQIVPPAAGDGR